MSKHNRLRTLLGVSLIIISSIFISCSSIYKNNIDKITADNDQELEGTIRFVSNRIDKKIELEALISELAMRRKYFKEKRQ